MVADQQLVKTFNDSLERCTSQKAFLSRFYELFMSSSEEVQKKFEGIPERRVSRILRKGLYLILMSYEEQEDALAEMDRLGELHDKNHLDVHAGLYALWLNCLLQAVEELDPQFDPKVETAWRTVMKSGIELLLGRYDPEQTFG